MEKPTWVLYYRKFKTCVSLEFTEHKLEIVGDEAFFREWDKEKWGTYLYAPLKATRNGDIIWRPRRYQRDSCIDRLEEIRAQRNTTQQED